MFSTDKQMGCRCFMNVFDLRDPQMGREVLTKAEEHSRHINNIQTSVDLTMFISASKVLPRCIRGGVWFHQLWLSNLNKLC